MNCDKKPEIYSRIVGYFRPVQNWNHGKKQEFEDRKEYSVEEKFECSAKEEIALPESGSQMEEPVLSIK